MNKLDYGEFTEGYTHTHTHQMNQHMQYDLFKTIKEIEKTYDESNKICLKDWIC